MRAELQRLMLVLGIQAITKALFRAELSLLVRKRQDAGPGLVLPAPNSQPVLSVSANPQIAPVSPPVAEAEKRSEEVKTITKPPKKSKAKLTEGITERKGLGTL